MSDLPYVDELRQALTQLGEAENELSIAKNKKDLLREKIHMWLDMNDLREFEIIDATNTQLWRMTVITSSRRSADFDVLENMLTPQQFDEAVATSETQTFKCQPVKSTKKSVKRAPTAVKPRI